MALASRPLLELWPALERHVRFSALGDFPTPVEPLAQLAPGLGPLGDDVYVKRDELSSALYGGNKVRTLEPLLGQAQLEGREWVAATGAYGSNHAVATVLHGARLGLRCAAILFPQPFSPTAAANLRVSLGRASEVVALPHWSFLPFGMSRFRGRLARRHESALVMPPGGAIPRGCLGFLSGSLELGAQVQAGVLPAPAEVVLAVGSTCSSAGLLVGLLVATRLGLGFGGSRSARPLLVPVRVTPWPVTSRVRIVGLARRLASWLYALTGDRVFEIEARELARGLELETRHLGRGYGRPTAAGQRAIERRVPWSATLDTTYSAKSAAALLDRVQRCPPQTRLFWSTKSAAPLPEITNQELASAPRGPLRWLQRGASSRLLS
jgi:D-cysteine desulfhydrase